MAFQNIPYLYQNKNGSFRVLTKGVDEYFKATEKDKAIKFAKNFQKKLDKEIKGFLTRQQLGEKLGIKDLTIERAKKVNSKLWNEISNQMEIKKVGSREYYKFKGKEKDAINSIKKFSGAEAFKGPRDVYAGKETIAGKIRKILRESEVPLNVKEIEAKLPKGTKRDTINSALADIKTKPEYSEFKKKVKLIDKFEQGANTARIKAEKRAPFIKVVRDVFVKDPDATTQDVAEAMIGSKKYNSASLTSKYNYDTAARKNIIKFLEVVSPGSKQKIKGFKDIDPDKLGNILESIESRISDFGFESGTKRQAQLAIADAAKGLPPRTGEELMVKLRQKGKAVDHVVPLASVFKDAPGYTEAGQVIDFDINKKKGTTLDAAFGREFKKALKGDFSGVEKYNDKALNFATKNKVDTPVIIQGDNLNPRDYIKNFDSYSEGAKLNIINLAKEKGIVIQTNTKTLASLADELIKGTETFSKTKQIEVCNFLSNGGLPGDCKRAIRQDPKKAAQIISKIPADTKETAAVKESAQKLIRLYRGEAPSRSGLDFGDKRGTYFTPQKDFARYMAQGGNRPKTQLIGDLKGKVKRLDIPEKLFKELGGNSLEVNIRNPELLKQAKTDVLQTALAKAEAITPEGAALKLKWDNTVGAFTIKNGDIASQADIKLYAEENPMPVEVDTKPPAGDKNVTKGVFKTLAKVGAPLPTALIDSYFIGQQVKEGKSPGEIASDPLNWIGLAAMEPLAKVSGIAESGKLNKALRLGLNPATIRGISRFAGLPGLAVSTAMTAYDQYKKYQNQEGFVYDLFNKEGK